jgi:hypothetical protein
VDAEIEAEGDAAEQGAAADGGRDPGFSEFTRSSTAFAEGVHDV